MFTGDMPLLNTWNNSLQLPASARIFDGIFQMAYASITGGVSWEQAQSSLSGLRRVLGAMDPAWDIDY